MLRVQWKVDSPLRIVFVVHHTPHKVAEAKAGLHTRSSGEENA